MFRTGMDNNFTGIIDQIYFKNFGYDCRETGLARSTVNSHD